MDNNYYGQQQQSPSAGGFAQRNNNNNSNIETSKIFVGGLSWQTTEESLRWHFEQYGTVVSTEIMRDRNTGDPRGFGFVSFADSATVDLVMQEGTVHEVNHKVIDVKRAQARGIAPPSIHQPKNNNAATADTSTMDATGTQPQQQAAASTTDTTEHLTPEQAQTKVFVGGIPPHIDRDQLREIFQEFGPVSDAIVMIDQATQRSRCFGFVTFQIPDGAQKAVAAQPLQIHGRRVEVKLATPRSEQQGGGRRPMAAAAAAAAGPRHVGLRAGQMTTNSSSSEYAGLAVAYGRNGWKAGYGSKAFGKSGWGVIGWDSEGKQLERSGFSFAMLERGGEEPASKRFRH